MTTPIRQPAIGDLLVYNGITWVPVSPPDLPIAAGPTGPTGPAGPAMVPNGDLAGTTLTQTVIKIQGHAVSTAVPADGYALVWNGTQYVPTLAMTPHGDLSGTAATQTVVGIQNVSVSSTTPDDGYVLSYDNGIAKWKPTDVVDILPSSIGINPSGEPIGFENRTDSEMSFNDGSLQFTIQPKAPATSFAIWNGNTNRIVKSAAENIVISNVVGPHFIYYNNAVLTDGYVFPGFNKVLAAFIYWDGTKSLGLSDERHQVVMDWSTHAYLHSTVGTRYQTGLTLQQLSINNTGAVDTDAQVSLDGGIIWDEDISMSITRSATPTNPFQQELGLTTTIPGKLPIFYRIGVGGTWTKDTATNFAVRPFNGIAGARIGYNLNTAGTWSVADPGSTNYVAAWIVATDSQVEPVIAIMGQRFDTTSNNSQNNNIWDTLSFGTLPFQEMKVLFRLIFRTNLGYANSIKAYISNVQDLRNVSNLPSGTYVATDHGSLSGRTLAGSHPATAISTDTTSFNKILSASDTDVQLALDTIDEHYHSGVITEPDPTAAATLATDVVGPRFGKVVLAPLGTGASDVARDQAVHAACAAHVPPIPVIRAPGTWYLPTATTILEDGGTGEDQFDAAGVALRRLLRVMIVGDSISLAAAGRAKMRSDIMAEYGPVEYVGSVELFPVSTTDYSLTQARCHCFGGAKIEQFMPGEAYDIVSAIGIYAPDVIILQLGVNNIYVPETPAQCLTRMGLLLDAIVGTGIRRSNILVCTTTPVISVYQQFVQRYNAGLRDVCEVRGVHWYNSGCLLPADISGDTVHPTAGGYSKLGTNKALGFGHAWGRDPGSRLIVPRAFATHSPQSCLTFNITGDQGTIAYNASNGCNLTPSASFVQAMWLYVDTLVANAVITGYGVWNTGLFVWQTDATNGDLELYANSASITLHQDTRLTAGSWNRLVVVGDAAAGTLQMYVNGTAQAAVSAPWAFTANAAWIIGSSTTLVFKGAICDWTICRAGTTGFRVPTMRDIFDDYYDCTPGYPTLPGVSAYYPMHEGSGAACHDQCGGTDMVISGCTWGVRAMPGG